MNLILATINIVMSLNFTQIKHPLAMGLTLLIQTIIISLACGLYTHSYWFAYILFLIMLGGMLVLFIYVTSLASNELFSFSVKNMILSTGLLSMMLISIYLIDTSLITMNNIEMTSFNLNNFLFTENELSLIKLYNNPTMNITILMMNYLLLTLIVVVKITNVNHGPLRQKF
uniref:NADH dehydrogenase subunit 6 n=1 Tax=Glenoleon pulchellus TaxID=2028835 RepID=UPI00207A453D|nr:NADH dehydrogenase subunit 6 [Glenoleon pulchellus]URT60708.1 NADH dehydrogenase subunit 6 [Glenoleon pulchellus]